MNEKKGKVFDEKGRLFGKINIIDIVVLLLIVAVAVFLLLKFTNRSSGLPGEAATSQIEYSAIVYRVTPEVYSAIEAEVALGGEQNIALGGDWDGISRMPRGFAGIQDMDKLFERLLQRNYSEALVRDLFHNNLMRVVNEVCTM